MFMAKECAVKLTIENSINKVFNIYGYHNIQTPTFEFFDIFSKRARLCCFKEFI